MIRKAKVEDYSAICGICIEALGYDCASELVKYRLENIKEDQESVFVTEAEDTVVGFVHVEKYNALYYKSMANILGLAVARKYQKKGYGKSLMEAVENWARENNINLIRLNSGRTRKEAHEFYRNIGYGNEKEQIRFMKEL